MIIKIEIIQKNQIDTMDIRKYFKVISPETDDDSPTIKKIKLDSDSWVEQGKFPKIYPYDFMTLWNLHPAKYGQVRIAGKFIDTPRWQQSYCKPYWFSGMHHEALPLPEEFLPFLVWANTLYEEWNFNQVLINFYNDGNHCIGQHTDNESQLVPHAPIVCISLGQQRVFRVRRKSTNDVIHDINMPNESYLAMCGRTQENFTHEVPKVQGQKGKDMGKRISITFRVFK